MIADFPTAYSPLFTPGRYKVFFSGRGAAKSWSLARGSLILGAREKKRIVCTRETMQSIRDSVHALLKDQIEQLGLKDFYEVQQAAILGRNGTEYTFAGLRHNVQNIKSLEGADIVWVEEAQTVSKESWETLIPTVRKDGSQIWVSFNPLLETDDTYKRFILNPPPGAAVVRTSWRDNPWFPEVLRIEMEHMKATDPAAYEHVWEGATRSAVEGAIYGEELKVAEQEGRITQVSWDRTKPVDTFWDLGYQDNMAIWFAQAVDGWYNVIDYLEHSGEAISWYLIQLQRRGYMYGNDWLPHDGVDAIIHHRLSSGDKSRSVEMLMRAAGRNVRIAPKMLVNDGINAVRTILPQCRFDRDKCADGLQRLRHYQWGPLPASGKLRREPLHDLASHGADGFRTLAVAIRQPRRPVIQKAPIPKPVSAWS